MSKPRILYFDIETSPMLVWTHYIGHKVAINPCQVEEHKKVICISYNWSDDPADKVHRLTWNKITQDDTKMLKKFNDIAREADLILGHNGQNFDVKELRTAIALRGLAEAWCETPCLDTLKDYRRMFRLPSNRLDAVAQHLGLGCKNSTNFQLWIDVVKGDRKALEEMGCYCDQDVILLRQVHERLDAYVKPTVAENNLKTKDRSKYPDECIECGNKDKTLFIKYGPYTYKGKNHQKYLCKVCSKINRPDKEKDDG